MAVTPESWVVIEPGEGLLTTLHCVPFQYSVSVWLTKLLFSKLPTVQMSLAEIAVRAMRRLLTVPGEGLLTTLHCVPFQCSISECWSAYPTVQASLAEIAVTLKR